MIDTPALQKVFLPIVQRARRRIPLGTCTHPGYWVDQRHVQALKDRFNVLTPEVAGGFWWVYGGTDYPAHGWDDMDILYKYALDNYFHFISYPLRWWFPNADVQPTDIEAWITESMQRYALTGEWIIVNEGYWDGLPTIPLIEESYQIARKVRPGARLAYNGLFLSQYEWEQVQLLIANGLVDAVGIQFHLNIGDDMFRFAPILEWLKANRVPWWISEMDVCIPELNEFYLQAQAVVYRWAMDLLYEYNGERLCMWGAADAVSWQKQYNPLPWGLEYEEKLAAGEVLG